MAQEVTPRLSRVAYVVIRLQLGARECFLLRAHPKWGDWSLVGGHVEASDASDRAATARREAEEEMPPLVYGRDFTLEPITREPLMFGPEESRSSGGPTVYETAWFCLRFLRDPITCLNKLTPSDFRFVERARALASEPDASVSSLLRRLDAALPTGVAGVPLAWPSVVEPARVRIPVGVGADEQPPVKTAAG